MARKQSNEEEVQVQEAPQVEVQVEEIPETPEVTAAPAKKAPETTEVKTVTAPVKKVKIRTTEEVNCIIAGVPYNLGGNKEVQVPSDVAAILVNGGKAFRL